VPSESKKTIKILKVDLQNDDEINRILNKYLININKLLCLDFHGVTDLYEDHEKIPSSIDKCIISYISGSPTTIKNTINTMTPRILSNEVILGIIVYNKNDQPSCGTKGWILSKIIELNVKLNIFFIDDSKKNIQCVNNIKSNNIKLIYINKNKDPKTYLTKILNKI
jgi:hypothetical protein